MDENDSSMAIVLLLSIFSCLKEGNRWCHRAAPKGSFGWPLIGETLSFFSPHASNTVGIFLEEHCSRYGKVFRSHLFCTPTIVSCDQELNHFILQNEERLFQCSYPKPIHGILGKSSMIVVVGETHKRLRNLALTLVATTKSRDGYLNDIESTALHIIDSWKDKKRVFFCEEARKFTFSVIVKQVLGLSQDRDCKDPPRLLNFHEGANLIPSLHTRNPIC